MSVVIVGGNERMIRQYEQLCKSYSCKAKVYIETDKNVDALKINKDMGKLTASITAIDNQGKYKDIVDATNKTTIKVRGNSTALADKKAYNITFNKKKDLFGLSSAFDGTGAGAKKWSLLANAFDKSLIRNNCSDEELRQQVCLALQNKPQHHEMSSLPPELRGMSQIGG